MTDLEKTIQAALQRFQSLPLAERIKLREEQRRSWVVGEMLIEHPEFTRAQAEKIFDDMLAGWRGPLDPVDPLPLPPSTR